ncbi:acetone carboxylase [Dactylosporangium darangshiense]|uniref:acetone carboxylase n=1 Tax=Dactylosporangium darangshiense TaxID=579108 RepID=UPI0031E75B8D
MEALICSAKGCRSQAVWQLLWNNPKIHTPDRRKVWLACDDHRESLSQFLSVRGFLRDTVPIDDRDTLDE